MLSKDEFLDLTQYERQTKISEGYLFKYVEVIDKKTLTKYVAKISRKKIEEFSREDLINFSREVNILVKLKFPSIVNFCGYSPTNFKNISKPMIFLEKVNQSIENIIYLIERKKKLISEWNSTKKLINIFGIASSMRFLHSHDIIHRNLKPSTIMVDDQMYPKLTGFTNSQDFSDTLIGSRKSSKYIG